jgi:hypothetical protein
MGDPAATDIRHVLGVGLRVAEAPERDDDAALRGGERVAPLDGPMLTADE